jgi:hypothetical protein
MNKKVLISVIALLVLFAVTPVMAAPATKTPFTAEASFVFGNISPGIEWEQGGIYHVQGVISSGTFATISGTDISGTLMIWHDLVINTKTGLGECHGKVILTVEGVGTFEGSEHGTHTIIPIPDPPYLKDVISGSFVLHGTGEFERLKMMGSYEAEMVGGLVEMALEGIILSPLGEP